MVPGSKAEGHAARWAAIALSAALALTGATLALSARAQDEAGGAQSVPEPSDALLAEIHYLQQGSLDYHRRGDLEAALPWAEQALELAESALPPGHLEVAVSSNNLALLYREQGRYAEAEPLYRRAMAIWEAARPEGHPDIALALSNLGDLLKTQGRYTAAEPLYRRALAIWETALPEGHPDIAIVLNNLGSVLRAQGRYAQAEPLYRRALAIWEAARSEGHPDIAYALTGLGVLLESQGRYAEAEPLYRRALTIREAALPEGHPDVALALNNLGSLLQSQGRHAEAEPLMRRVLAIYEAALPEEHPHIAEGLGQLAILLRDQGRYAEAESLLRRALAIRERALPEGHPDIAYGLTHLGDLLAIQGRHAEAEPLVRRALAMREDALPEGHPDIAETLDTLAALLRTLGRNAEAEPPARRALAIRQAVLPEQHPLIARSLDSLGSVLLAQGRPAAAEPLYRHALAISRATLPAGHSDVAVSLGNLANLLLYLGDPGEAAALLAEAARIYATTEIQPRSERRAWTFRMHGAATLSISDGISGPGATARVAEAFASLQWLAQGEAGAALLSSRARLSAGSPALDRLARQRDDLRNRQAATDRALLEALAASGAARNDNAIVSLRARYDELGAAVEAAEAEMTARFPTYAELALPRPLSLEETQALLGRDEVLVTFALGDPSIAIAVTAQDHDWDYLPEGETILSLAGRLRCQAAATDPACGDAGAATGGDARGALYVNVPAGPGGFDLALAHELYDLILGRFEPLLSDKRHLILAPDGALLGFPFQLLVTAAPEAGLGEAESYRRAHWLIRTHALSVLPTPASLRALRGLRAPDGGSGPARRPFVGFGDPVIGSGGPITCAGDGLQLVEAAGGVAVRAASQTGTTELFGSGRAQDGAAIADVARVRALARLPDTRCEVEAVATRLGAEPEARYLDRAATETRLKRLSSSGELADYRLVLFSTHGLVAGEAGAAEPALVLTPPAVGTLEDDGLLTASEVAALKLNAEWVILSACNTASGARPQAESLSGLARAFFYAGARSLLVSHWPVYSDATVALVTAAVAHLATGRGRAEALRQAMLAFLDPKAHPDPRDAHPARWAPFSLVGEGAG